MFRDLDYLVIAFLVGALLASCVANAGEILIHGPSYHFDREANYNDGTYGLGYMTDKRIVFGAYENSERSTSVYAGYSLPLIGGFSVSLGAVTGYERAAVLPAALLTYSVHLTKSWNVHFNAAPVKSGFLNLSVGYEIGK